MMEIPYIGDETDWSEEGRVGGGGIAM